MRPLLLALLCCPAAHAAPAVGPTASLGVFFEFGDEGGPSGGFDLWLGGSIWAVDRPEQSGMAPFASVGLGVRTGFIPFLAGPTELVPQVRLGGGRLAGIGERRNTRFKNLTFPDGRLYALFGYRWESAFGWDNTDGHREGGSAFRLGLGSVFPILYDVVDGPLPNGVEVLLDLDGEGFERAGFSVLFGF